MYQHTHCLKPLKSISLGLLIASSSLSGISAYAAPSIPPSCAIPGNCADLIPSLKNLSVKNDLRFMDADSSNFVGFQAAADVTANVIWKLPAADGTSGFVLTTDGTGNLTWAATSGVGKLSDLSDVNGTVTTIGNILIADGSTFNSVTVSGDASVDASGAMTISNNAITESKIADSAVTNVKLADNATTTSKLADGAVTNVKLADNVATTTKIADAAVTDAKLANSAATTAKIANAAVTVSKLADGAVTDAKLANSAATTAKLANNAVTAIKISDAAVITAKLADNSVSTLKITDNAVTGTKIQLVNEAAGSVMYSNGADWINLPKGSAGQALVMNAAGTAPVWATPAVAGANDRLLGMISFMVPNAAEHIWELKGQSVVDAKLANYIKAHPITGFDVSGNNVTLPDWRGRYLGANGARGISSAFGSTLSSTNKTHAHGYTDSSTINQNHISGGPSESSRYTSNLSRTTLSSGSAYARPETAGMPMVIIGGAN